MFFKDLLEEFGKVRLQDDHALLEWLHRLFRRATEREVSEIPNREAIATAICDARGINHDVDPHFPPPETTAPGDPVYAAWLIEESIHSLRLNPDRPSPLFKYYETTCIQIEIYLGIKPK